MRYVSRRPYLRIAFFGGMKGTVVRLALFVAGTLLCQIAPSFANEAITYTYDTLGRLVVVSTSGSVNNSQNAATSFDPAGNRTGYTVTGASGNPAATLSIGNASVTEGGTLSFTVTRSGAATGAVSADYAAASGTATSGSDFTAAPGTVSFAAGETSKTISVPTIDDSTVESAETLTVTLSSPTGGATIATVTGIGTINDNDGTGNATISIGWADAVEGSPLTFTVTRTGVTSTAVSANYTTSSNTATSGADFTAASSTVSFAAGETSKTITVSTTNDSTVESPELMLVTLSGGSAGTTFRLRAGQGTIHDKDSASAIVSISNAAEVEGGWLRFWVTRTGNTGSNVTVNYTTSSGSASSGLDFASTSGTLTLSPYLMKTVLNVSTTADSLSETNETMALTLSSPSTGATLGTVVGTGTVYDDDSSGSLAVIAINQPYSSKEGDSISFLVTRYGKTTGAVSVNYSTSSKTATSGADFSATSGALSFAAGETQKYITVPTMQDTVPEPIEGFKVTLSGPSSGAAISADNMEGWITDDGD